MSYAFLALLPSREFGLVGCGTNKVFTKQVAGEEVVIREDFLESYSTFPDDLNIPLGISEQLV